MELQSEIKNLKGIGPKKQAALKKIGVLSIEDLLFLYPRDYEDRRNLKSIDLLKEGENAVICAKIQLIIKSRRNFGKKQTLRILVEDSTGAIEIVFFQMGYLEKTLRREQKYIFFGKIASRNGRLQMIQPDFHIFEGKTESQILPIYPLTLGLTQKELRKWQAAIKPLIPQLNEFLPEKIIKKNRLCSFIYAMVNIHFPQSPQKLKEAKFRLVFNELFLLQTGLMLTKNCLTKQQKGISFSDQVNVSDFIKSFPYSLTKAQLRVVSEINKDMESSHVMNRLVQGDVGSGKTAVAAVAIFKAVKSGFQVAMMAPTELLAKQHYEGLNEQFNAFNVKVGFLSGSLTEKQKKQVLFELEQGNIQLLIGTHALIQKRVVFKNLGLVITDEQHRFGVNQRTLLTEKGQHPDVLVMTATPIPRTLAIILYGDLDYSVIDEMPPGRKSIETKALSPMQREQAYTFLIAEIKQGRQAYVVAPLIEESEAMECQSAVSAFEEFQIKYPQIRAGLLYGTMKQSEKDKIMQAFYERELDILFATVVIEVGINVPNATVMLIENAERFGLAQLHQLRGRVGRGTEQSYCLLIADQKNELAKERAKIMARSNDGFFIAEEDLKLRGPGEFFGMRQHGIPELKIADLGKHIRILETVKKESISILEYDPFLKEPDHTLLRMKIEKMFENVENIGI